MRYRAKSVVLGGLALALSVSCASDFDDKRIKTEPTATLGDDLFSALCDRVGASALREDLSGASYRTVCHRDALGNYGSAVDESLLPPVAGGAALTRRIAVAKVHAMARRRSDLIAAFNATFSDQPLPDPQQPGKTVSGHDALDQFLKRVVPLYDSNPIDDGAAKEPLMPSVTRATGRLFAALGGPGDDPISGVTDPARALAARQALSRLSGRLGYRPLRVTLGALRPALAYPELRQLAQTFTPRLGAGGPMRVAFQNVLGMTQFELDTSPQAPLAFPTAFDAAFPARPRTNMEIAQAVMLATDPAFAGAGSEPRYLVGRDVRGYAIPASNVPGTPGTVPAPFFDGDGDGFADVDALGRFVTIGGAPAPVDTPFLVPGIPRQLPPDSFGRAIDSGGMPLYGYIDTSETFTAATLRDLEKLLAPDEGNEALADLLSGAFALYGDPIQVQAGWAEGGLYPSFDAQNSPIVELLHATGWVLAHKNSDMHLELVKRLFRDHEQVMARVIGAALRVREIANQRPDISLDPSVTLWDEMAEILARMSKNPSLTRDLLRSLRHPDVQAYIGPAYGNYTRYKDLLHYDTNNLNGPPLNLTTGGTADPSVAPDPNQPDAGDNRSQFHRILQIIHDVNDVNACNKPDAKVRIKLGLPITYPFGAGYKECELFVFKNMGVFYLHSILGKAKLEVRPDFLNGMMSAAGIFTNPDDLFQTSSGITGMGLSPTPQALDRLVFFGAESPKFDPFFGGAMPDRDPNYASKNDDTNKFVSRLVEAISPSTCPERAVQDPNGQLGTLWLSDCSPSVKWAHNGEAGDPKDLMRLRNRGTIFTWEKYEFYKAMRPLLKAFDDNGAAQLFLDKIEVFYRHWASQAHGAECNSSGDFAARPWQKYLTDADRAVHKVNPAFNPKYCNGSGVSRYEPILSEAFVTDLIPAVGELVGVLDGMNVQSPRTGQSMNGLDILNEMTVALFDPDYAKSIGVRDRQGKTTTRWANGKIETQLTPFGLFADALARIDERLGDTERRVRWKRARSQLVDRFLSVSGEGVNASFDNRAFVRSIPILLDVLRVQLNANCPDRETSPTACKWATLDLGQKAADTFSGAPFATTMTLIDQINEDPATRSALQKHLRYLMQQASSHDALHSTLTSANDMMQILGDDLNMPLIYNAIAVAVAPKSASLGGKGAPGTADRVLELMDALTREVDAEGQPVPNKYDPYRVVDRILANLVSPIVATDPASQTPIEVFIDTIAEVNRIDADAPREEPLSPDDLEAVFGTLRDFMTSPTRGMEQLYEIMRHRNGK